MSKNGDKQGQMGASWARRGTVVPFPGAGGCIRVCMWVLDRNAGAVGSFTIWRGAAPARPRGGFQAARGGLFAGVP